MLGMLRGASSPNELAAFAGQVSHDLKNPLAGVAMSIELAREEAGAVEADSPILISLLTAPVAARTGCSG